MKLKVGILLVVLTAGQILPAVQDQASVVCKKKQQQENSFFHKTKEFVRKYAVKIAASIIVFGGTWFVWRQIFGSSSFGNFNIHNSDALESDTSERRLYEKKKNIIYAFGQYLSSLPKDQEQTIWLLEHETQLIKLLEQSSNGECEAYYEFRRLISKPGMFVYNDEDSNIRSCTTVYISTETQKIIDTFFFLIEQLSRLNTDKSKLI